MVSHKAMGGHLIYCWACFSYESTWFSSCVMLQYILRTVWTCKTMFFQHGKTYEQLRAELGEKNTDVVQVLAVSSFNNMFSNTLYWPGHWYCPGNPLNAILCIHGQLFIWHLKVNDGQCMLDRHLKVSAVFKWTHVAVINPQHSLHIFPESADRFHGLLLIRCHLISAICLKMLAVILKYFALNTQSI